MSVEQRSVVEVPFNLPQGLENHPVIVLSTTYSNEQDYTFIAVMTTSSTVEDEYTFLLSKEMFIGNLPPKSYQARTHLVSMFSSEDDIIINSHHSVKMKEEYFHRLMARIFRGTFGYNLPTK